MHEINNPLGTIAACAETMTLALAELPAGVQAPPASPSTCASSTTRCTAAGGSPTACSTSAARRWWQRARLDLGDVVERTLTLLKHHTRFKRCPVRLDLADAEGGPAVHGDPDQLTQVLMILLLNAADAVAEAPPRDADDPARGVTVRTGRAGSGEAVLEVDDEGVGIPAEARDKLFEPFYTTKAPGEGTGLGLSIAYGIVRDLAGRLDVDSVPGQGSRFRVVLPAA